MKQLERIMKLMMCILSSVYLTYVLAQSALITKLQVGFIFTYFLIISVVILYCYKHFLKNRVVKEHKRKLMIFSLLLTLLVLLSLGDKLIPKQYGESQVVITATGEKNDLSMGKEIRITSISVDGESIKLGDFELDDGWYYSKEEATIMCNLENSRLTLELNLPPGKSIDITFVEHGWSGIVEISDDKQMVIEDLYDANGNSFIYATTGKTVEPSIWVQAVVLVSSLSILFSFFFILLMLISINKQYYLLLNIIATILIFRSSDFILLNSKQFLALLVVVIVVSEVVIASNINCFFSKKIK